MSALLRACSTVMPQMLPSGSKSRSVFSSRSRKWACPPQAGCDFRRSPRITEVETGRSDQFMERSSLYAPHKSKPRSGSRRSSKRKNVPGSGDGAYVLDLESRDLRRWQNR